MITPDILLGQGLIDIFLLRNEACITLPSGLVLTPTVFGYAISGNSSVSGSQVSQTLAENGAILVATPVVNQAREEYKQDIKNLYELESLGIKVDKEDDEESILQFMNKYRSTIQIADGKITAGFTFLSTTEGQFQRRYQKSARSPSSSPTGPGKNGSVQQRTPRILRSGHH
ncbi:hypothetical protein Aduo_015823 [Ancylostoma duodenale]